MSSYRLTGINNINFNTQIVISFMILLLVTTFFYLPSILTLSFGLIFLKKFNERKCSSERVQCLPLVNRVDIESCCCISKNSIAEIFQ